MEYDPYDSSGTDDDFPPSHQNRLPRGGRVAGNGRPATVGPIPYPRMYTDTDMENQIHQLEQEAYSSVLRAFKAQADAITWEKESLITELRKELRLSNEEHRELSTRVNSDDLIRRIREWRQAGGFQVGMLAPTQAVHDPVPSPTVSASRKKQKKNQATPSQSFGGPSPSFPTQPMPASSQPSSSVAKRGPVMGPKGSKKHKSGQALPPGPPMRMQQPGPGPVGKGPAVNRGSSSAIASEPAADVASLNSLIGRKVRTRWPDDNNFYEALITNYNPVERRHFLVYDASTENETWEWVDLAEISPEDIQWEGEDPGVSRKGRSGHMIGRPVGCEGGPPPGGRGRGTTKVHSRKDFPPSQNGSIGKKKSNEIKILNTDTLIKEVERVFSNSHPNPLQVEKAKKVLKEHEQALADAISRLAYISDGESDEGRRFLPVEQD